MGSFYQSSHMRMEGRNIGRAKIRLCDLSSTILERIWTAISQIAAIMEGKW